MRAGFSPIPFQDFDLDGTGFGFVHSCGPELACICVSRTLDIQNRTSVRQKSSELPLYPSDLEII
jgi:hypothetical protein